MKFWCGGEPWTNSSSRGATGDGTRHSQKDNLEHPRHDGENSSIISAFLLAKVNNLQ